MIEKYRLDVLKFYEQKKEAGELSANLLHFTPANLRNETRLLFGAGSDPMAKRILKEFFELPFDHIISDLTIKKCDPDKFKPLCNFLKRGTGTHEKNIELLAWLIDFCPRPFSNYWRCSSGKKELSVFSITESGIVEEKKTEPLHQSRHNLPGQKEIYENSNSKISRSDQWITGDAEVAEDPGLNQGNIRKKVTLEYPSGVKLSVDASDLSLIAQLVRL